ncbi:MAG: helix-turn-helix domain-containing protein [Oscillospiraceae bacterium]
METDQNLLQFCANIRYLRRRYRLSKKKMAQIMGVGVNTVTALENNIVPPRLGSSVLIRAGEYFHIRTCELFCPMEEEEHGAAGR